MRLSSTAPLVSKLAATAARKSSTLCTASLFCICIHPAYRWQLLGAGQATSLICPNSCFLGDNNFLIDRLEVIAEPCPNTIWYTRMMPDDPPRKGSCRLTVGINRTDVEHLTETQRQITAELQRNCSFDAARR